MKSEMTRSRFASCQTHMDAGDMPLFHSVCVVGCVVGNLPSWVISPWKSYLGTTLELIWTDTLSVCQGLLPVRRVVWVAAGLNAGAASLRHGDVLNFLELC